MNIVPSYICHAKNMPKKSQTARRLFQIFTQQILSFSQTGLTTKRLKRVLKEVVDGDDVGAKQSSVFAWQAVNLVNGSAVTRDGGPPALTALPAAAAAAAGAYNSLLTKIIQHQLDFKDNLTAAWLQR